MKKACLYLVVLLITLGAAVSSYGDELVIGNFENGLDGAWAGDNMTLSQSTTGATLGTQAAQVDGPGGWQTDIWLDASSHRDLLATGGAQISADVTAFDTDMTTGWMTVFCILNGEYVGWGQLPDVGVTLDGQPHTVTWDIPADMANTIATTSNPGWFQIVLGSNLDGASVTKFYVDNVKITYTSTQEQGKSTDVVISSFEQDFNDWDVLDTADPCFSDRSGVTLGDYSLDLYIADNQGWNGSFMTLDVIDANLLKAVQTNTKLSVDVTRLVDDWTPTPIPGWNEIVFGINAGGDGWSIWNNTMAFTANWKQTDGDKTITATFDYAPFLPEMNYLKDVQWFTFMITSNVDSAYPGPVRFYMDNMKLTGAGKAVGPSPAADANSVGANAKLSWRAGTFAASHILYLGTDATKVTSATLDNHPDVNVFEVNDTTYEPNELLKFKTHYFWRVDEVNDANPDSPWKGSLWNFTTGDFLVIDDFEDYNNVDDTSSNAIFNTWVDGYQVDKNGSFVGYSLQSKSTICEPNNVYSGNWSMPFYYDNTEPALTSEAQRTWEKPQVWVTGPGINTLKLYIYGNAANIPGKLYVDLEDASGISQRIYNPNSVPYFTTEEWQEWDISLNEVADVNLLAIKKMTIGVDNIPDQPTAKGMILIDSIRRCPLVPMVLDPNHIDIRKTPTAPVIDGVGDGIWQQIDAVPLTIWDMSNADSAKPDDANDLSASFKTCFDDNNFYIFVEVNDSVINHSNQTSYNNDSLELYFDGDYSHGTRYDGVNDNHITIETTDSSLSDVDTQIAVPDMTYKVLLTDKGYNIEASFPLSELQIAPSADPQPVYDSQGNIIPGSDIAANNVIGLEVQINDDDTGTRDTMLRWFSNDNNSWQDPSLFGQARLLQDLVGE